MEYTTLGDTGMSVSRICLGCMSFGEEWDWTLPPEESREIIERAIDLGINFFDTANVYCAGESEEILGDVLADYDREEVVVATKVYGEMGEDPNAQGLSRKAIEQELSASLNRLGMDAVDLYQIHRWDYDTPIEETLRALDDAVRRNQVRYIGASSMWAHQFADALHASDSLGLERFVSMQNHYNLVYREEAGATERGQGADWEGHRSGGGREINARVEELAEEKGRTMAQIGLAWLLEQDIVTAPIVGTTSVEHLEEAVEALEVDLSADEIEYLEEPYEPREVAGHD